MTDGQLPLRQCLHPEACAKEIELPSYYCRFIDLRKEVVRYLNAVKKSNSPNMPNVMQTPPASIAEMIKGKWSFLHFISFYFYFCFVSIIIISCTFNSN